MPTHPRPLRSHPRTRPGSSPRRRPERLLLAALLASGLLGLAETRVRAQGTAPSTAVETGNKGAQVYCYMRANGNGHEVSWSAAYALIKRQGAGPFKTSPEHAAVMITEAVVQNPTTYPDCGRYLGDLFTRRRVIYAPTGSIPPASAGTGSNAPAAPAGQQRW